MGPPTWRALLSSGPLLAAEAFGGVAAFWVVWRVAGLTPAIVVSTVVSTAMWCFGRRCGRSGWLSGAGLAMIGAQALVGLMGRSETAFLAPHAVHAAATGGAFVVSAVVGRPLVATIAHDVHPLDPLIAVSPAVTSALRRITLVWGVVLIGRAALRSATLLSGGVDRFMLVTLASGVPCTAALLTWSFWLGGRAVRRAHLHGTSASRTPTGSPPLNVSKSTGGQP